MEADDGNCPPSCPNTVTVRRNPHRRARPPSSANPPRKCALDSPHNRNPPPIPSFPIDDILSMDIPIKPQPDHFSTSSSSPPPPPPPPSSTPAAQISENLKVFLRIRPVAPSKSAGNQSSKPRQRNVWPQNPAAKKNGVKGEKNTKMKSGGVCISLNDSHSVTLSPPPALQESKRSKSEVFEGFSYVFAPDSSQNEVYEKMVKPLVNDLLIGNSVMIAALGPSGTGKTHTVFGTPRDPGMVPLALRQIFERTRDESDPGLSRLFYISIFEIYSDRGKVERVSDLTAEGAELSVQQSSIKGLQEVAISDAAHAESLIASAMLKRATAMTNTNSQSSRSQCIINIQTAIEKHDGEYSFPTNNAVLTIVDLAGAEREKRTGNQGSRLLESNFINNTSMVFGLCLRSLLEHQKNPKKPLQKHFQSSLLTRYLRDYLEGKKRMALILTVKPGEQDFLDTAYLLRQASPYMKIKYNNVDESSNPICNKRHIQQLSRVEQAKRMKCSGFESYEIEEGKKDAHEKSLLEEDPPRICKSDSVENASVKLDSADLATERKHQIMENFARALWKVLKQYKGKLMDAEREIQNLNENLRIEKTRYTRLEKELEDFKSGCTCSEGNSLHITSVKVELAPTFDMEENGCSNVFEKPAMKESSCYNSAKTCDSELDQDAILQMNGRVQGSDLKESKCNNTPKIRDSSPGRHVETTDMKEREYDSLSKECNWIPVQDHDMTMSILSSNLISSKLSRSPEKRESTSEWDEDLVHQSPRTKETEWHNDSPGKCDSGAEPAHGVSPQNVSSHSSKLTARGRVSTVVENCGSPEGWDKDASRQMDDHLKVHPPNRTASRCNVNSMQDQDVCPQDPLDPPVTLGETVGFTLSSNPHALDGQMRSNTCSKPPTLEKPKRRLLPASSTLLRDIANLGMEDEPEKPKVRKGGKKMAEGERILTQGSTALLRLLQSNLRL